MSNTNGKSKGPRYVLWTIGLIITVLCALLILYSMSYRSGTEFCPQTFAMRGFDYRKMPITGWVVRGIEYRDHGNFVGDTLLADKWITAPPERRWDLVSERSSWRGSITNDQCDAQFLVSALQKYEFDKATKTNKNKWIIWSEKHPNCAKEFWPLVAKLARNQMYLALPDLMQFARDIADEKDVDGFKTKFEDKAAQTLIRFAKVDEATGKVSRALARYQLSQSIDGNTQATLASDRLTAAGVKASDFQNNSSASGNATPSP